MKREVAALCFVLGASGCGLDLSGTSTPAVRQTQDATVPDAAAAQSDATAPSPDAAPGADAQGPETSSGADAGSCVMCGSTCVPDCNACATGNYDCHGTCVSGCDKCGSDFVVCLVCPDGGTMTRTCSSAGPSGCLGGAYSHCPCNSDNDCPADNQRCSGSRGFCAACGESLFNSHDKCNQGCCCKTGPTLGQCNCSGCG